MKRAFIIFFFLIILIIIFSFNVFANFVRVTSDFANIRLIPDTESIVIGQAIKNDIFEYEGQENDWIKINMFSEDHYYIHHSLVKVINYAISVPFSNDICQSLMKRLDEIKNKSQLEADNKFPLTNSENVGKNNDYQKLLIDRYILEVFHEYNLQPVVYQIAIARCMEGPQSKIGQRPTGSREEAMQTFLKLTEETKKKIFIELLKCEDWGDMEAMQYYFPGCENCTNFIVADIEKYIEESNKLIDSCKEIVMKKYNITVNDMLKIVVEGLDKQWEKPEVLPMPDCCE